jgi:cyclophilin family peptidyl-prolyl cis-trans isomerase/HEAT repeat protein
MRRVDRTLALVMLAAAHAVACVPDGPRPDPAARDETRVLVAEDARASDLLEATDLEDARARLAAVRALGRLEDPALVAEIAGSLADTDDSVRAAAVEAMAQAVHGAAGIAVLDRLLQLVPSEPDPTVRASLARSIGRLMVDAAGRRRAADALVALATSSEGGDPPARTLVGVALGFEALTRAAPDEGISGEAGNRLEALATFGRADPDDVQAARIRALALTALGRVRRMTLELVEAGSTDPDPEVRRTVLRYLDAVVPARRAGFIDRALTDPSPRVVLEALRIVGAGPRTESACERLLAAAAPEGDPGVRAVALTALGRPCPARTPQVGALRTAAAALTEDPNATWQPAARALVSLARIDGPSARGLLTRYVNHPSSFVRVYAAHTAALLDDEATLEGLARDTHPNVRSAALQSLFEIEGHGIEPLLIQQLGSDDPQLLITVAGLLAGSTRREEAADALLGAFERISAAQRETWRDPRRALLERIAELGGPPHAPRLEPFLSDYDALVAEDAAAILTRWSGRPHEAAPVPLPRDPLPTTGELAQLSRTTVALHMRGHGPIVLRLMTDVAPRNAWRFVRLAREGYYDGLTFHRWEPNFVIQGGSPGANEYAGDGPYTRDEVGAPHWRGTVGLSTRGRDTGDGQFFINLVDNVRLDHDYTVFAVVSEGMDVVDRLLEGAVIERVEVSAGSQP